MSPNTVSGGNGGPAGLSKRGAGELEAPRTEGFLPTIKGALVAEVNADSPTDKAGIKRGDIIIIQRQHPIGEMNDLPRLVADTAPGTKANVKVLRDGKEKTFNVTVSELTEERQASEAKEEGGGENNPLGLMVKNITPELAGHFHLRDTNGVWWMGWNRAAPRPTPASSRETS